MAKGVGFYDRDWFVMKEGRQIIYESIIRTLLTSPGERVMRPEYGVGLKKNMFGLVSQDVLQDLTIKIHNAMLNYETRIITEEVTAELIDNTTLRIGIVFREPEDRLETPETVEIDYNIA
jgi:phage baseplate assembly protein W